MKTRQSAVAGLFYPDDRQELQQQISSFLKLAKIDHQHSTPRALIVPHAGYIYSGLSAAFAYNTLVKTQLIKRVILLGPAHRVAVEGMAVPSSSIFNTPLGDIPLDQEEIHRLINNGLAFTSDLAHEQEHSLEVQLPFLQTILPSFKLVPIVVGQCPIEEVSALLKEYISDPSNLIIISTDLSHFLDYSLAQKTDQATSSKIMNYHYNSFEDIDACGRIPMAGMLKLAKENNLSIQQLDLRNSGDTAGDKQRVVGYGSWSIYAE
jgi:MEMO1 family protein